VAGEALETGKPKCPHRCATDVPFRTVACRAREDWYRPVGSRLFQTTLTVGENLPRYPQSKAGHPGSSKKALDEYLGVDPG